MQLFGAFPFRLYIVLCLSDIQLLFLFSLSLLTKKEKNAIIFSVSYLGVAQLVARYLGVVEAARSSRVTQTISSVHNGFEL